MKFLVTDIKYDTDYIDDLPKEIIVDVPNDVHKELIDDYVSDQISNITGFCHFGFSMERLNK